MLDIIYDLVDDCVLRARETGLLRRDGTEEGVELLGGSSI